jgi:hypothetical protein
MSIKECKRKKNVLRCKTKDYKNNEEERIYNNSNNTKIKDIDFTNKIIIPNKIIILNK